MGIADCIEQAELLTSVYGRWPSFHDARVRAVRLSTDEAYDQDEPMLEAVVHVHRMTDEVDERGLLVLKDRTEVNLQFFGVRQLQLQGFGSQNDLYGLRIVDVRAHQLEHVKFEVAFDGSGGLSAKFACHRVRVASVQALPAKRER